MTTNEVANARGGNASREFVEEIWANNAARTLWEPRLLRVRVALGEIEWLSVAHGMRACCILEASPGHVATAAQRWSNADLEVLPVQVLAARNHYLNTGSKPMRGEPVWFRIALGRPPALGVFKHAWDSRDDDEIGRLLGYPPCCREFFKRFWVDLGLIDLTWAMAWQSTGQASTGGTIEVFGAPQCNLLWRWMGIRAVTHLPCRFDCEPSVQIANQFIRLGQDVGFKPEMDWLSEVLSWPVEWSSQGGVAEIQTPVMQVRTLTDTCSERRAVRLHGIDHASPNAESLSMPCGKQEESENG